MPADRTKADSPLVWTTPVDPTSPGAFSFAANLTPVTFSSDMPPLVDAPDSLLFPPVDAEPAQAPRRTRAPHSKKKPANHIPRPPNAFILFRSSFIKSQHVSTDVETNHSTLSQIIGMTWQSLPDDERAVWHAKAKQALEEHRRRHPDYAFRPLNARTKHAPPAKRKVREVDPKDLDRCSKIASLLVQGKKGSDLAAAVHEFDSARTPPPVVARFADPITARAYRRSASAPVPTTPGTQQQFCDPSPPLQQHDVRLACTRPTSPAEAAVDTLLYQQHQQVDGVKHELTPEFDFTGFSFDASLTAPMPYTNACGPLDPMLCPTDAVDAWSPASSPFYPPSMPPTPSPATPDACFFPTYDYSYDTGVYATEPTCGGAWDGSVGPSIDICAPVPGYALELDDQLDAFMAHAMSAGPAPY